MAIWNNYDYGTLTDNNIRNSTKHEVLKFINEGLSSRILTKHVKYMKSDPDFSSLRTELVFITSAVNEWTFKVPYMFDFIPLIIIDDRIEFTYQNGKSLLIISNGYFGFSGYLSNKMITTKDDHFNEMLMNPDIEGWEFYELINTIQRQLVS